MNNIQYTYNQPPQGEQMPPFAPVLPQPPMPMSRRARWGQWLMSGPVARITTLPNWFAAYAVATYAIALLGVNLVYSYYATEWYFWLFGIGWVAGFFYLSVKLSQEWNVIRFRKPKTFEKKLFRTGFWIRLGYVIFIYFFYLNMTGQPHEFSAADSVSYIEVAQDFSMFWDGDQLWHIIGDFAKDNLSDLGYPLAILLPIRWLGEDSGVIVILIVNALLGAYTNVLIYRITRRSMGETTARIASIFCMLHPVLVCYAGLTLKEVLMTMLVVIYIELADRVMREKRYTFTAIAPMVLVGLSLFLFRTVLAMIVFMALFFALVMSDSRVVSFGKKLMLGVMVAFVLLFAASENIMNEIRKIADTDVREQQEESLEYRYGEKKNKEGTGNSLAKYAGTAVFAPLIFTIPFPTMVQAMQGQEDMRLIHGGNWMRNVMSGFVILAMFMLLLTGDWRKYTLPLAMLLGYLLMLAFTQFAHSLRFHIPVMPFEMMFAAYAITNMRKKHKNWYLIWCMLMVVACFAWNWFKLSGRGLT